MYISENIGKAAALPALPLITPLNSVLIITSSKVFSVNKRNLESFEMALYKYFVPIVVSFSFIRSFAGFPFP